MATEDNNKSKSDAHRSDRTSEKTKNPPIKLGRFLRSLRRKGYIAGLDLGDDRVRLVLLQRKARAFRVANVIEADNVESLIERLKEKSINIKRLYTSIPRNSAIVKYLTFPSADPKEVEQMLRFEVEGLVPFSEEEIIWRHYILETDERGYSKTAVFIVPQVKIEKFLSSLGKANITPYEVGVSSISLFNWFLCVARDLGKHAAVINVNQEDMDLIIVKDGRLVFSRAVQLPPSEREEMASLIANEINTSLSIYQGTLGDEMVSEILLFGDTDEHLGLVKRLKEVLPQDVRPLSLLEGTSVDKSVSNFRPCFEDTSSWMRALGSAAAEFAQPRISMNFLPQAVLKKREMWAKTKRLLTHFALGLVIVFLLFGILHARIQRREEYLAEFQYRLREISPAALKVEAKQKRLRAVKDQLSGRGLALTLLGELFRITPPGISINSLSVDLAGGVVIRGQAERLSQAFDYITILEKSNCFCNVKNRYAHTRTSGQKKFIEFELTCQVEKHKEKGQ